MDREKREKVFMERLDTGLKKRNAVARKVAALLAESAATMPEVDKIMEQAKRYLVVTIDRPDDRCDF